jgi:pyruvate dehydrogenase E2 component (dihydrolipoamide acetyltransferase)
MEEGTIVDYKVKIGDKVEKGDSIYEVETDKATLEVESPADGFVKQIIAEVGQTLLVGDPVLVLADEAEEVPQGTTDSVKAQTADDGTRAPVAQAASGAEAAGPAETAEIPASASLISGLRLGDVIPLSRLQKTTGQKMLQSKREIPCFHLSVKADVTELVEMRERLNSTGDVRTSYNDFIMRALCPALERFPIMTGRLEADSIVLADDINVGLVIALADALVVPVVRDVNKKKLVEIARESTALIEKARAHKLAPDDLEGGCITISSLGAFGIESNTALVVPGQCSILGAGTITDTCVANAGKRSEAGADALAIRKMMNLTLSADHRITNGAYAAQFLDYLRRMLQDTSTFTS